MKKKNYYEKVSVVSKKDSVYPAMKTINSIVNINRKHQRSNHRALWDEISLVDWLSKNFYSPAFRPTGSNYFLVGRIKSLLRGLFWALKVVLELLIFVQIACGIIWFPHVRMIVSCTSHIP